MNLSAYSEYSHNLLSYPHDALNPSDFQVGGLSAPRTLRDGYQPHVWRLRMTPMISHSRQKKVKSPAEMCIHSLINRNYKND